MARAITSDELALLRSDKQRSLLRLYIDKPSAVFSAQVSGVPESSDEVLSVAINNPTGTAANVKDGMTVLIGTAAGGYDIGILRAQSATTALLTVGVTSDILWAVGQYITVLDDYLIWARALRYSDGLWNIEGELAYSDQHTNFQPVPVLGPTVAVLPLVGSSVVFTPTAADSWVPESTISAYAWTAPGASATANLDTATPTITYNTPGTYRVTCTLTAANGKTATGYRLVYVPGTGALPAENFSIEKLYGEQQSGGWEFSVTLYDAAELSGIRPQALVVLYADDYYGATKQAIGPVAGYENIVAIGWIDGATIDWSPEVGLVKFAVKGPSGWMQRVSSWPVSLLDTTGTPEDWMHIQGLTIDKGLWHMVSWRSTAAKVIDVYPSGDTRRSYDCSGNLGNMWEQLKAFAIKIGADPICDRYGRLFLQTDAQLVPVADRSSIPVVMDITKEDWRDTVNIQKRDYRQVSLIEVAGFNYVNGAWGALMARAPGNAMSRTGAMTSRYNFLFADQANANEIAALLFGKENNQYPTIPIQLSENNRMIDIAPRQYLSLTVGAVDTPLGIAWNAERIIPRRVEIAWDKDSGMLTTDIECERATVPISPAVPVVYPQVPTVNLPELPDFDNYNPLIPTVYGQPEPYTPPEPPIDPSSTCHTNTAAPANGPYDLGVYGMHYDTDDVAVPFNCMIRSASHENLTRYEIHGRFEKYVDGVWQETAEDDWYDVAAHIHYTGSYITGVHDVVSNPRIRTGILSGGVASRDINDFYIRFAGSSAFVPDSVDVTTSSENNNWTLSSIGEQVWWKKGNGVVVQWRNLTGVTGGAAYNARIGMNINFSPPTGVSWQGKNFLLHLLGSPVVGTDGTLSIGGGVSWITLASGARFPASEDVFFGNAQNSNLIHNMGLGRGMYLTINNKSWNFSLDAEVHPYPTYRILIDNFLLYNICPPIN